MLAFWMGQSLAFPKDSSHWLTGKEVPTKSNMPIAPEWFHRKTRNVFRKLICPGKSATRKVAAKLFIP